MDNADAAIQKSSTLLCTDLCPCKCENAEVLAYLTARNAAAALTLGSTYTIFICKRTAISPNGVVRAQDCSNFQTVVGTEYDKIVDVLGFIEDKYSCSGLCQLNDIYLFSNINNGLPRNMCLQKIIDEMKQFIIIMGSIGISVGGILFFTVIAACFLCCKIKKQNSKVQDEYQNIEYRNNETNFQEQKIEDTF